MNQPQPAPGDPGPQPGRAAHDPWSAPLPETGPPPKAGPGLRADLRDALLVLVGSALVGGAAVGLLWYWLAPSVALVSNGEALFPRNSEGEGAVAADGTFLLAGIGVGVVLGVVTQLLRRRGGVPLVLGLAVGSALGALLAWRLGILLEPPRSEIVERGRELEPGGVIDAPRELTAWTALLGLPFGALAGHAACFAAWGPRDPQPRLGAHARP
ncbi:ABC transporter permease [Streptomyces bohaiensis]|uniref:ABC transporter permease n=1 Tax=Streptomyces bohaiensis TaxID=1431344 RepID=A0ABX1CBT1_9ACTN|nr:ABC transporter permease [Streptomyces bohaiensis]NJQ14847.1 ABC transporter permease [Streptomyces bohaiensis]